MLRYVYLYRSLPLHKLTTPYCVDIRALLSDVVKFDLRCRAGVIIIRPKFPSPASFVQSLTPNCPHVHRIVDRISYLSSSQGVHPLVWLQTWGQRDWSPATALPSTCGQCYHTYGTALYRLWYSFFLKSYGGCLWWLMLIPEIAYGLKYVELNNRSARKPWSTRQSAIYHRYAYGQEANTSTWVLVASSRRTKRSVGKYVRGSSDLTALNPFEIHLIILDTSLANWRPYIIYLTEQITEQVEIWLLSYPSGADIL